jgi:hypothetical protein
MMETMVEPAVRVLKGLVIMVSAVLEFGLEEGTIRLDQ